MPKKPTTTKENMIEGTFQLIRHNGYEAFSARNLAAFLGCSTQPIFRVYENMEALKTDVYARSAAFYADYYADY